MEAEPMFPELFRVTRNRKETAETRTLELASARGGNAPVWRPGQFMMLYAFGTGEIPISLSGDPARSGVITHTVRAVGPVSRVICEAKPGFPIGVRGPFGTAWPTERYQEHDIVLVAGGIGLAPLRPALYAIIADRSRYGRVSLLVGSRNPDIVLYRSEMDRWRKRDIDVRITVDSALPGWHRSVGPVTTLVPRSRFDAAKTIAFIVGPEVMTRFAVQALSERGIPADRLFVSLERNMKCAVGFCGRCQLGSTFLCKDGPIFPYAQVERWLTIRSM
jgi:NAD(P)H-flavin reductase